MKFSHGFDIKYFMSELVDDKIQVHEHCVDLTVKEIFRLSGGYEIDFSGNEHMTASKEKIEPEKRNKDDKYGWWTLEPGIYMFQYNEQLMMSGTQRAIIQVHSHLMEGGASHPTIVVEQTGDLFVPVTVFHDFKIKQNARVSEIRILQA